MRAEELRALDRSMADLPRELNDWSGVRCNTKKCDTPSVCFDFCFRLFGCEVASGLFAAFACATA